MPQMISCPYCGKLTNPRLEACPHCGGPMQQKAATPSPGRRPEARPAQTCPNCRALVQDGDIICVACGTNLLTGQKIAGRQQPGATARNRLPWIVLAIVIAAVLLLFAVLGLAYVLTRNPVQQALALAAANKEIEAAGMLSKHLQRHPRDVKALTLMGKLDWKRGRFSEAAASFEAASDIDRKDPDLAMIAVLCLASENAANTRDRRIDILKRVTADFPNKEDARYLLALEQGAANNVDAEIETLKSLVQNAPDNAVASESLGVAQALSGDYTGAEQLLDRAAKRPEQSGDALAALGFTASLSGKPDRAVEDLRAAVERNTSAKRQVLTRLGVLLVSQGRLEEAQRYLGDAVAAHKDETQAQFFYAVCLQGLGLIPEALNTFEQTAQKQGPFAVEALLRIGELQLIQGNSQKARDAIDKAEAAGITSPALYTVRGRVNAALGEDDRARENFQKALKIDANYAPAHLENGLLHIKQQSIDEGVKELEKYLSLVDPNQAGTRSAEVQAMIAHLKQAAGKEQAPAGTAAGERSQT